MDSPKQTPEIGVFFLPKKEVLYMKKNKTRKLIAKWRIKKDGSLLRKWIEIPQNRDTEDKRFNQKSQ